MSIQSIFKSFLLIMAVAASASAATVQWYGTGSTSDFADPTNWIPAKVPGSSDWARIAPTSTFTPTVWPVTGGIMACFADVGTGHISTPAKSPGYLTIGPGTVWTSNSGSLNFICGLTTMTGGTVSTNKHILLSDETASTFTMTGGSFNCTSTVTMLDSGTTGEAYLNIHGGTFRASSWRAGRTSATGVWRIQVKNNGQITLPWNGASVGGYLTSGNLQTGNAKQGLVVSWDSTDTKATITARETAATPLSPYYKQTVMPGTNTLMWAVPEMPSNGYLPLVCNVYFGTYAVSDANGLPLDPTGSTLPLFYSEEAEPNSVSSTAFTAVNGEKYQWRVDCYLLAMFIDDDPYFAYVTVPSTVMYVSCQNAAPVVTIGTTGAANPKIGLREGTVTYNCTATVTDDGMPPGGPLLAYTWSQVSGPPVSVTPVYIGTETVPRAMTATMTVANTYTFRLSVDDSAAVGTGDVTVTVYPDRCTATKARGVVLPAGDMNGDCRIDFLDMALLSEDWLICNSLDPAEPACN
jgi:hypothetical protein